MPKCWRISTTTGERTAGGDYGYATVWSPTLDELIWGIPIVPVSDDETVTISFIRTSKTRIFCLHSVPKSDVSKRTFMPK